MKLDSQAMPNMQVILSMPNYILIEFLEAIYLLLKRVQKEEKDPKNRNESKCIAFVIPAVILAAFWLESAINVIKYLYIEKNYKTGQHFDRKSIQILMNKDKWERKPILEKYNLLLKYLGKDELPKGGKIYQNAQALIELRDEFAHVHPFITSSDMTQEQDIFITLLKGRYNFQKPNSLNMRYRVAFNSNCICWAIDSIFNFFDIFWKEFQPNTEHPFGGIEHLKKEISQINWKYHK